MWKKIIHITINHEALDTFKKGILNELNALNRKWDAFGQNGDEKI